MVSRARPVHDSSTVGRADPIDAPASPDVVVARAAAAVRKSSTARSPQNKRSPASPAQEPASAEAEPLGKRHEVLGLLTLALAVLSALALASYDTRGGRDWAGPAGTVVAEGLIAVLGTASVLVPLALLVQSIHFFRRTTQPVRPMRVLGTAAGMAVPVAV